MTTSSCSARDSAPATTGFGKLLLDALSLVSSRFVQIGTQALYLLIAARMLGPEVYGQLTYAQSWYLIFLQFASLGLQSIVLRDVGRGDAGSRAVISATTSAVLLASVGLSLLSAMVTTVIEADPGVRIATQIFSFAVVCRAMSVWMELLLLSHQKGRRVLIASLLVRPLEPIIALILLATGHGIVALAALHVAAWGVQALIGLRVLARAAEAPRLAWRPALLVPYAASGLPLMLGGAAMAFLQFGPVLTHRWADGAALGELAILAQIVAMLGVLPLSLMQTLLPSLSHRMAKAPANVVDVPAAVLSASLVICTLAATLTDVRVTGPIVELVLGPDYAAVIDSLWIPLILVGLYGAGLAINQRLVLDNRHVCLLISTASGAAVFLLARLALPLAGNDVFGPETVATPLFTLSCVLAGYLVWLLVGGWFSGLLGPLLRALLVPGLAVPAFLILGGTIGIALAWVMALGIAWHQGVFARIADGRRSLLPPASPLPEEAE